MLNNLEKPIGSTFTPKRIGRGYGSTTGKTSGKGHKGQKARSGNGKKIGFEGGQMPIHRRLPKIGFKNLFRIKYTVINLDTILTSEKINKDLLIDREILYKSGILKKKKDLIKILGNGEINQPLQIQANAFSAPAEAKIMAAGGRVIKENR